MNKRKDALVLGGLKPDVSESQDEDSGSDSNYGAEDHEDMVTTLGQETLEELYREVSKKKKDPNRPVTPRTFARILKEKNDITEAFALKLFDKIDWATMHKVPWTEFCTFLQLEFEIKFHREQKRKIVEFCYPVRMCPVPARSRAIRVIPYPNGLWVTISEAGELGVWNNEAKLLRFKVCISKRRMKKRFLKQWITDAEVMPEFHKVVVATGDRELQFFEFATFAPFCQLSGFESVPICLHYRFLGYDRCMLLYGDEMGCVSIINMQGVSRLFMTWKQHHLHDDFIPSMPVRQAISDKQIHFRRWQIHSNWVNMVRYYPETDQIISCSVDPNASLVLGAQRPLTNVARMRKGEKEAELHMGKSLYQAFTRTRNADDQTVIKLLRGVDVFDFSYRERIVATGGGDRIIRLWNCFHGDQPLALLRGHYNVIRYIHICHVTHRMFSCSADRWVKVWHTQDHVCLLTLPWHVHQVVGILRCVAYNPKVNSLGLFSDNFAILRIKVEEANTICKTHAGPVNCVLYNSHFDHVITAGEDSSIKTWSLITGKFEVDINEAHGESGIVDMVLGPSKKRLISVARDGTGKMWSYCTGQLLRSLEPEGNDLPAACVTFADMYNVQYIITAGWGHKINLYVDDTPNKIPFEIPRLKTWRDCLVRGHTADILCADFSGRDKLATGSFDGTVIVWHVDTGYKACSVRPPPPTGWRKEKLDADRGVSVVHYLKLRSKQRKGGNLVVGGPYGRITIWNTSFSLVGVPLLAAFSVNPEMNTQNDVVNVTAIDSDVNDNILISGDANGFVTVWDISNYALTMEEPLPPQRVSHWAAHIKKVTSVKLVSKNRFILSGSSDFSVRLWNIKGHFVGTFGQRSHWELENATTFRHPEIPRDVRDFYCPSQMMDSMSELDRKIQSYDKNRLPREGKTDRFDLGFRYFARAKAKTAKYKRHLIDEKLNPMSAVGTPMAFRELRTHRIQADPPPLNLTEVREHFEEIL